MKKLLLTLMILTLTTFAYADHTFTITITDEEYKVLQWQLVNPDQWVIDAIKNKILNSQSRMLLELSDKQPNKLTEQEKKDLIISSTLPSRVERDAVEVLK